MLSKQPKYRNLAKVVFFFVFFFFFFSFFKIYRNSALVLFLFFVFLFSSTEPFGSQGELIVYPSSSFTMFKHL